MHTLTSVMLQAARGGGRGRAGARTEEHPNTNPNTLTLNLILIGDGDGFLGLLRIAMAWRKATFPMRKHPAHVHIVTSRGVAGLERRS